jgi:hypothetical protein
MADKGFLYVYIIMTHLAHPDDKVPSCRHVHWQCVANYLRTTIPVRTLTKKI